jgi:hypothetical protein
MGREIVTGTVIRHLHEVRKRAEEAGLLSRVVQASRSMPPVLVVVNPDAGRLCEEITCVRRGDGEWWLTWSWGDPICRADDVDGAAAAVLRVVGGRTS